MGLFRKSPTGFLKFFLRAPIALYQLRLGWLLTSHLLMLTTKGRKSGKPRRAVVEVVQHDKSSGNYYVMSGWGRGSDWFLNIMKEPKARVDVGFRRFEAIARVTPDDLGAGVLYDYACRYPAVFEKLTKTLTGEELSGTREECSQLVQLAPMVSLQPPS